MKPDQIREIALRHAREVMGIHDPRLAEGIVEFATRFLAEIQKASEPVAWGVDWSRDGDRSCCSIVKKHPDGTLEVVGIEYGPPAPAIPDDMVLVPREPTEAMIKAVMPKHYGVVEKYKAMIAVAEGVKK